MGVRINTGRRRVGLAVATSAVLPAVLLAGCSDAAPADVAGAPTAGASRAPSPSPSASAIATAAATTPAKPSVPSERRRFRKAERITGALTPKSVDASTDGFVVAQNMIYTHTVSVFGPDVWPSFAFRAGVLHALHVAGEGPRRRWMGRPLAM